MRSPLFGLTSEIFVDVDELVPRIRIERIPSRFQRAAMTSSATGAKHSVQVA